MFHNHPSQMSLPCRNRNREALVSSVYHSTPLFRGLITLLDRGLNRHNPCPCTACQTSQHKRQLPCHPEAPAPKRARRRSSYAPPEIPAISLCPWCAFPHHSSRTSCRECARRAAPPPMAQHFHVPRSPVAHDGNCHSPDRCATTSDDLGVSFAHEQSFAELHTPSDEGTDLSTSYDFSSPPSYPSPPLPPVHESIPLHAYAPNNQPSVPLYHSPQSTVLDVAEFADHESVGTPEARSMASKSITPIGKHEYAVVNDQLAQGEDEIDVASLMNVSREARENACNLREDRPRFSLVNSALSDVTAESVVELGGLRNQHSEVAEIHKTLPEQNAADLFLSDMIMSGAEEETTCNDISDLPLTFLDGILPPLNDQDAC